MQNVEPFGFVLFKHSGNHWVDKGFNCTITKTKNNRAPIEEAVSFSLCGSKCVAFKTLSRNNSVSLEGQERIEGVADETKNHRRTITDVINDQTKYDNTDRERPDSCSEEFLCLNLVQSKCAGPKWSRVYQECSCDERKSSRNEGDKTPPK